jgi:hypothetical protein
VLEALPAAVETLPALQHLAALRPAGAGRVTLSPWDGPRVRGVDGPAYKVSTRCSNPGCNRFAEHVHHIFRRSDQRLGKACDWVEIKGAVYQNKTGVCPRCHDDLTGSIGGHKAAIRIEGDDYDWTWMWCVAQQTLTGYSFRALAPIEPQPLTPEAFAVAERDSLPEPEVCPTCGHVKRARLTPAGRARKTWTVLVPDDDEDGAAVLDTLVDDLALILGVEPNRTGRYFVIVPALYHAHQDKRAFADSLRGVGG